MGADVIAVSRSTNKLQAALDVGATHTVTAGDDAAGEIQKITGGGHSFHWCV
ncbi:MAG: zinc-binding dehydrogenase [Opitutales bacterium]|nr:zinc-binding dehydrogenase [Opitutales bacterium]MBT5167224.1 zinc-binding dehydrogenase [Opitutales bacterium]MBT5812969.1 zinc-binding dehydrogenase [Opitutales bacterium]MBT6380678.1 zinc-binding dehydrogenase [Opitutales bacterium]